MTHSLPSPKLLGIVFFAFWLLAYSAIRYSIRNRKGAPDGSLPQSAAKKRVIASALFRGRLYLFSGGIAILLGTRISKYKEEFLIAGAVTFCFGCYFLLVAKKLRRDAATAAKP
jgi:hypothetical protein